MRFNPRNNRGERTCQNLERIESVHLRGCMAEITPIGDLRHRENEGRPKKCRERGNCDWIRTAHQGGYVASGRCFDTSGVRRRRGWSCITTSQTLKS
jgi:hypothetical protein